VSLPGLVLSPMTMAGAAGMRGIGRVGLRALLMLAPPLLLAPGCTCGSKSGSAVEAGAPAASTSSSAAIPAPLAAGAPGDGSMFSAPIAGARSGGGGDVLAGLVAKAGVVRVMGVADGRVTWTADALKDVAWSPDAELVLQPAHGGFALVWRGMHAGKTGRTLVLLGPGGESRDAPVDIGP
jgi:hypothetical protein